MSNELQVLSEERVMEMVCKFENELGPPPTQVEDTLNRVGGLIIAALPGSGITFTSLTLPVEQRVIRPEMLVRAANVMIEDLEAHKMIEYARLWWASDLLRAIEGRYPEHVIAQVQALTRLGALYNLAWMGAVIPAVRSLYIPFWNYQGLAPLPPTDQLRWAPLLFEGISGRELRRRISDDAMERKGRDPHAEQVVAALGALRAVLPNGDSAFAQVIETVDEAHAQARAAADEKAESTDADDDVDPEAQRLERAHNHADRMMVKFADALRALGDKNMWAGHLSGLVKMLADTSSMSDDDRSAFVRGTIALLQGQLDWYEDAEDA